MEEGVAFAEFRGTDLGAEIAVRAVDGLTLKTRSQDKRANGVAPVAVGAGSIGVRKLHGTGLVGLE